MSDFWDRYEDFEQPEEPEPKTCRNCSEQDLHWEDTSDGWRLFNMAGLKHDCQADFKPSSLSNLKPKPF